MSGPCGLAAWCANGVPGANLIFRCNAHRPHEGCCHEQATLRAPTIGVPRADVAADPRRPWVAAQDKEEQKARRDQDHGAKHPRSPLSGAAGGKRSDRKAAGYAVFSNFGMKILVAGRKGQGVAVDKAGKEVFMKAVEVQAGLGMGIKKFRLIWVFETRAALDRFISSRAGSWEARPATPPRLPARAAVWPGAAVGGAGRLALPVDR